MATKGIGRVQIDISQTARRGIGAAALAIIAILGWAWWDGGEEPMRPIAQTVELPGTAQ